MYSCILEGAEMIDVERHVNNITASNIVSLSDAHLSFVAPCLYG